MNNDSKAGEHKCGQGRCGQGHSPSAPASAPAPGPVAAARAGVLYPFFGVLLSPIIASTAMSVPSGSGIGNAPRLRGAKL